MTALYRIAAWVGGSALVFATGVNTLAVIGRRTGVPLHGAIEIVQVCVLVAGGIALMLATAWDAHARIRLVLDRIEPGPRDAALRVCAALAGLTFAALCVGSAWIAGDLWSALERSEILGLSWQPLRAFATAAMAVVAGLFAWRAVRPQR